MNYAKISGQFVCKMAMLLAFMFAACSETNSGNGVAGGTVEETGVYALAGRVGDVYPKLLNYVDSAGADEDLAKIEGSLFASEGAIVTVYELDSSTLEKTGRSFTDTIDNDNGKFVFEELSLKSPYVLIETLDSCYSNSCWDEEYYRLHHIRDKEFERKLNAIVDLRKIKNVNVSSLTTLKVSLLQEFYAGGKTFAEANKMAEQAVLEDLGIYEDLGIFEEVSDDNSELSYVNKLNQMVAAEARFWIDSWEVPAFFAPYKAFSMHGKAVEQFYLNTMKMLGYKVGYMAHRDGLGRCTESRENETGVVIGSLERKYVVVVCRSGKWTVGFKTVDYVKGTMTDSRDGKTYKTVTYNFGGSSQTWMAENLEFSGMEESYCYYDNVSCEAYGRVYPWNTVMGIERDSIKMYSVDSLGDTAFVSRECTSACVDWKYYEGDNFDSLWAIADSCYASMLEGTVWGEQARSWGDFDGIDWEWNYADYVTPSNQGSYQGVCPEGWRIPTLDDWKTLLQNLGEQYGVDEYRVVPVLYDEAATGFGMKSNVKVYDMGDYGVGVRNFNFYEAFVIADPIIYLAEFFNVWRVSRGFGFVFPSTWHDVFAMDAAVRNSVAIEGEIMDPYLRAFVRCIKQ